MYNRYCLRILDACTRLQLRRVTCFFAEYTVCWKTIHLYVLATLIIWQSIAYIYILSVAKLNLMVQFKTVLRVDDICKTKINSMQSLEHLI